MSKDNKYKTISMCSDTYLEMTKMRNDAQVESLDKGYDDRVIWDDLLQMMLKLVDKKKIIEMVVAQKKKIYDNSIN